MEDAEKMNACFLGSRGLYARGCFLNSRLKPAATEQKKTPEILKIQGLFLF
jgi:hypothetical protein